MGVESAAVELQAGDVVVGLVVGQCHFTLVAMVLAAIDRAWVLACKQRQISGQLVRCHVRCDYKRRTSAIATAGPCQLTMSGAR